MKKNRLEKLLSDPAVIVVLIPAVSIMMAYVYKIGFFMYFKIPFSLVSVSAKDVSIMAAILLISLIVLLSFDVTLSAIILDPLFKKYEKDDVMTQDQYELYSSFIAFLIIDSALLFLGFYWPLLVFFSLPLVIIPVQFLIRHFRYRPDVKAVDRHKKERRYYCESFIASILGAKTVSILIIITLIMIFTTAAGLRMASLKKSFLFVDDRVDIIGVELHDDYIIAKRVDDRTLKENAIIRITDEITVKECPSEEFYSLVHEVNKETDFFFRPFNFKSEE